MRPWGITVWVAFALAALVFAGAAGGGLFPGPPTVLTLGRAACGSHVPNGLAYRWPVKPFDRPHPVRGNFGDPRTIFTGGSADSVFGGSFAFHNGIDISAPVGAPVYSVTSGQVVRVGYDRVVVRSPGRHFQYWHVDPSVVVGKLVSAGTTVLGRVLRPFDHVHLTEIDGTSVVNPLEPGHLTPYLKFTRPVIRAIDVRASHALARERGVSGRVWLIADAYDRPALQPPPPWGARPVTPALVGWELRTLAGRAVVPLRAAADFRTRLPNPRDFWRIYAEGSYQNRPVIGRTLARLPGRYLFDLTPGGLDTARLRNGRYRVTVVAADACGNEAVRTRVLTIRNPAPSASS